MATVEQVVADHDEVALDHAEHVARLARPGGGHRLPGRDRHRAGAGVPGGRGHLHDVLLEGAARLVHGEGGEALHLRVGGDHRDPHVAVSSRAVRAAASAAAIESRSLGSTITSAAPAPVIASRIWPVDGRRPGPPRHDGGAGLARTAPPSPAPAATATTARPVRATAPRRADALDLLGEVGDPDPVRPAGLDAGLDGGADVVDVHVDVPQAVAADHDERVAERGQRVAQRRDRGRRRRRAGTSPRTPARPASGRPRRQRRPGSRGRRAAAGRRPGDARSRAVSAASRTTHSPRPPASTTPASRSTCSCSGVRARASRAAAAAARDDVAEPGSGSSARRSRRPRTAARATEGWCPRPGVPTAA